MIVKTSIKDGEAFELFRDALNMLMVEFPLCGLSYLGVAVEVHEETNPQFSSLSTDGRRVWYWPAWIKAKSRPDRIFDILHEWLHIFFNHVARRGDRDGEMWNWCCDVIVVREACKILSRRGVVVTPPKDGVQPPDWAKEMTVEQIYDYLVKNPSAKSAASGKSQIETGTDFREPEQSISGQDADDRFRSKFAEELAQAALIQQQINKKTIEEIYGPTIGKRLEEIVRGRIPWSRLLRGDMLDEFGDEFTTFSPPKMRYFADIILPSMRSYKEKTLMLGIDVSASVGPKALGAFKANVIPAALRAKETIIVTFDAVVREVIHTRHARRALDKLQFLTGAHSYTSTIELFQLVDKLKPTALGILTDGIVSLPGKPYPKTLWVITPNGPRMPWGRNYMMDYSW